LKISGLKEDGCVYLCVSQKHYEMKQIFCLLLFLLSFSFKSQSQDTTILKRTPYTLKVAVDKETFYEDEIGATVYIFPNDGMQIYPGETIYVVVEQDNGVIKKMTAVKEITDSSKTLIIKFSQKSNDKVHEMMILEIHNPFNKNLIYKAKMFLLKRNEWYNTNVYPVFAGLSSFETWPDIIISLGLGNWKFTDK
jgi:hypothetical protein